MTFEQYGMRSKVRGRKSLKTRIDVGRGKELGQRASGMVKMVQEFLELLRLGIVVP